MLHRQPEGGRRSNQAGPVPGRAGRSSPPRSSLARRQSSRRTRTTGMRRPSTSRPWICFAAPAPATVVAGLQTGVYNLADLDPSEASAAKAAGLDVFVQPGLNAENISININKAPFKGNPTLVEALRYAINRQQFVRAAHLRLRRGHRRGVPRPASAGYSPADANLWPYNLAKAKQLLAKAGYKPNQLSSHRWLFLRRHRNGPEAEIVQSQLAGGWHQGDNHRQHQLGDAVLRQAARLLALRHHRARLPDRDAQGPLRVQRRAEPECTLRGRRLRSGSRQGRGDADRLTRLRGEPAGGNVQRACSPRR